MDSELQNLLKAAEFPWDANEFKEMLERHSKTEVDPDAPTRELSAPPRELSPEQVRLLSSIELELRVEICSFSLSIDDVLDLVPGKIFAHELSTSAPVMLRLGSEVLAEARFVRQQGQLALQIISVPGDKIGEQEA